MAARYYIVQWCDKKEGWVDLIPLASKGKKQCEDDSEIFAKKNLCVTRVVRKPQGWTPPELEREVENKWNYNDFVAAYKLAAENNSPKRFTSEEVCEILELNLKSNNNLLSFMLDKEVEKNRLKGGCLVGYSIPLKDQKKR